ncbi:MAG: dihydropteroate synthase [Geminicoccaceae bacterium]
MRLLRPASLLPATAGAAAGLPLLGGRWICPLFEEIRWQPGALPARRWLPAAALMADDPALVPLQAARPRPFDGRPRLMGILNVTPDSFSDGGAHADPAAAVAHGLRLAAEGADIVDVGGESTRPGAGEVPAEEELRRVLPVVRGLVQAGITVSIDTRKAVVMRAALAEGATIVNDVSGLGHDPASLGVVAASSAWIVLMHMQGTPATMNLAPRYATCALEVTAYLAGRIAACVTAGISQERLIVDPGLCFGKHEPDNLDLMRHLGLLHGLGCPILLGASRKGWTAAIEAVRPPAQRLPGTLAATALAWAQGVQLYRVHDVAAHRQLLDALLAVGAG